MGRGALLKKAQAAGKSGSKHFEHDGKKYSVHKMPGKSNMYYPKRSGSGSGESKHGVKKHSKHSKHSKK